MNNARTSPSADGYGVGICRGSPLKEEIDKIILDLQHTGEIERHKAFCHAENDKREKSQNKIGILNFISAFILLAVGVLLVLLLLTLEHLYFKSGRKCLNNYDKCGCCALVSLSIGKSLTFEQSVLEDINVQRKHKCKNPICEMNLWKAKHELDMAQLKIKRLQCEIDSATSNPNHVSLPPPSTAATCTIEKTTRQLPPYTSCIIISIRFIVPSQLCYQYASSGYLYGVCVKHIVTEDYLSYSFDGQFVK